MTERLLAYTCARTKGDAVVRASEVLGIKRAERVYGSIDARTIIRMKNGTEEYATDEYPSLLAVFAALLKQEPGGKEG